MKSTRKSIATLAALALLLSPAALADSITFTGTVAASETYEVYAPIGGRVQSVAGNVGDRVSADTVLATLSTTKVYAEEDGTVTGVFGQPGDSAETVSSLYGSVISIEGGSVYSIAASTDNAYNTTATKFVHVGESVYLSCYSDGSHTGAGVITAIEGTSYTVRVTSGEFLVGETVNVYRGNAAVSTQRIGRGTLSRTSPTAVTGSGSIVSIAVAAGDTVQRGDLLFETLDGAFDGLYMSGSDITAGVGGIISQVNAQQGSTVQKDDVVAVLYPEGAMRIEASVEEANLSSIHVGDPVSVELIWNQDEEVTYPGTISGISAIADTSEAQGGETESAVTYTVYVDFTPDANTRYGMSAVVTTQDIAGSAELSEELTGDTEVAEEVIGHDGD
ncbi:MAG: HlyD family efflux transporter periplasmic adaptor subunit [Clostridia bacterium]|nr:HlyD family efflux transporter periplasmic adaptor subunit [Clostridia bacterium]